MSDIQDDFKFSGIDDQIAMNKGREVESWEKDLYGPDEITFTKNDQTKSKIFIDSYSGVSTMLYFGFLFNQPPNNFESVN